MPKPNARENGTSNQFDLFVTAGSSLLHSFLFIVFNFDFHLSLPFLLWFISQAFQHHFPFCHVWYKKDYQTNIMVWRSFEEKRLGGCVAPPASRGPSPVNMLGSVQCAVCSVQCAVCSVQCVTSEYARHNCHGSEEQGLLLPPLSLTPSTEP